MHTHQMHISADKQGYPFQVFFHAGITPPGWMAPSAGFYRREDALRYIRGDERLRLNYATVYERGALVEMVKPERIEQRSFATT